MWERAVKGNVVGKGKRAEQRVRQAQEVQQALAYFGGGLTAAGRAQIGEASYLYARGINTRAEVDDVLSQNGINVYESAGYGIFLEECLGRS